MAEVIKINFDIDKKALDEKLRELDATFRNLDNLFERYAGKVGTKLEAKFDLLREQFDEARLEYTDMSTKFRSGLGELDKKQEEATQKTGLLSSSFIRSERDIFFMSAIITELTNIIFSSNNDADKLRGDAFNLAISVSTGFLFGGIIGGVIALVTSLSKAIGDIIDAFDDVTTKDINTQFDIKSELPYVKGVDFKKLISVLQPQEKGFMSKLGAVFSDDKKRTENNNFLNDFAKFIDYAHKNNLVGNIGNQSYLQAISQYDFYKDRDFFNDVIEIRNAIDLSYNQKNNKGYFFYKKLIDDQKGLESLRAFGLIGENDNDVNKVKIKINNMDKLFLKFKNQNGLFNRLISFIPNYNNGLLSGISLNPTDYPTTEEIVTKNKKTNPNNIVGASIKKITINIKKSLINEIAVLDSTLSGLGDNAIQNLILSTITDAINDSQVKK